MARLKLGLSDAMMFQAQFYEEEERCRCWIESERVLRDGQQATEKKFVFCSAMRLC